MDATEISLVMEDVGGNFFFFYLTIHCGMQKQYIKNFHFSYIGTTDRYIFVYLPVREVYLYRIMVNRCKLFSIFREEMC